MDSALSSPHIASVAGSADVLAGSSFLNNVVDTISSDSAIYSSSLSPFSAHLLLKLSGWSYYSVWKLAPVDDIFPPRRLIWCHGGVNPSFDEDQSLAFIVQQYQRRGSPPLPQSRLASMAIQSRRARWANSAASIKAMVYVPIHEGEVLELGTTEMIAEKEKETMVDQIVELIGAFTNGAPHHSYQDNAPNELASSLMGESTNELASSLMGESTHITNTYDDIPHLVHADFGPPHTFSNPPSHHHNNNFAHPFYHPLTTTSHDPLFVPDHSINTHFHHSNHPLPTSFNSSSSNHDPFSIDALPSLVDLSHNFSHQIHVAPSSNGNVWSTPCETKTMHYQQLSHYPSSKNLKSGSSHSQNASHESGTNSTHYRRLTAFRAWDPLYVGAQMHHHAPSRLKRCLVSWLPKLAKMRPLHLDLFETSRTKSSDTSTYSTFECNNHATTSMQTNDAATQHMIAERRRRKRQRDHFTALKSLVPTIKKRDKVTILEQSLHYIQHLKDRVEELEQQRRRDMSMIQTENDDIGKKYSDHIRPISNVSNSSQSISPARKSNLSVTLHSYGPPCTFSLTMAIERRIENTSDIVLEIMNCLKVKGLDCIHLEFTTSPNVYFDILARKKEKVDPTFASSHLFEIEEWWKRLALNYVVNSNEP